MRSLSSRVIESCVLSSNGLWQFEPLALFTGVELIPDLDAFELLARVKLKGPGIFIKKTIDFLLEAKVGNQYVRIHLHHGNRAVALLTLRLALTE